MMTPDVLRVAAQATLDGQSTRAVALLKVHGLGLPDNKDLCAGAWQEISDLAGATTNDVVRLMRSIRADDQVVPTIGRQAQVIYQAIAAAYVMGRKASAAGGTIPTQ